MPDGADSWNPVTPASFPNAGQPDGSVAMRESCGCGAFTATFNRREARRWRKEHFHDGRPDPEPDKQGAESRVEHFGNRNYESFQPDGGVDHPIVHLKTGFQRREQ